MRLVLALLAAIAAASGSLSDNRLDLKLLPKGSPGVCLDGSPGGFYWRQGDPERFLVVLNGGGWCYDLGDCVERSHGSLGTSTVWASSIEGQGLTNSLLAGNPLANFSTAYLYYCDGASFASRREDPVPFNATHSLHFRGRDILDEILAELLDPRGPYRMDRAEQVVLGGHSAGGMATYHAADHVAGTLAAAGLGSASFLGMPDAGFFLPDVPDGTGNFSYRIKMQSIFALSNASAGVHPDCLAHWSAQGEAWRCMFPKYEAPFVRSPLFVLQSQYDAWQMENVVRLECDPPKAGSCSKEQMSRFQGFRATMRADLEAAGILPQSPTRRVWSDACIAHSQGYYGHYFTNNDWRVGGQTIAETLGVTVTGGAGWPGNASEVDSVPWPGNKPCSGAGL